MTSLPLSVDTFSAGSHFEQLWIFHAVCHSDTLLKVQERIERSSEVLADIQVAREQKVCGGSKFGEKTGELTLRGAVYMARAGLGIGQAELA